MRFRHSLSWLPILGTALVAALLLSLWAGALSLSPAELFAVLSGQSTSPIHTAIILKIRLPRALLAALVGAALGASGGAFQAVLRNPLADRRSLAIPDFVRNVSLNLEIP